MMERRVVRRNRVCLEGAVASGLTGPIAAVRVRNLSGHGAEVVVAGGLLSSLDVELAIPRRDYTKKARVVWRHMDRFGLRFVTEWPSEASDEAAAAERPDTLMNRFMTRRAG